MDHLATMPAAAPIGHPGTESAAVWAARIAECWRASIESIIRAGRLLIEAKTALPHGEFGAMCESDLPFSARTAQRLMAIAQDHRLSNPTHVSHLPASWSTLAKLTELSDDEFDSAIKQKIIRPDMMRADVEQIRALARPKESQSESNQRQDGEPGSIGARADGVVSRPDAGRSASATSEGMDVTAGETAPHSAAMPSGGLAIAHRRREEADSLDFFPTPPWATRALFEHVLAHLERKAHCQFQSAWEPACGEGHMAQVLGEYFRSVAATDICDYSGDRSVPHFYRELDFLAPDADQFRVLIPCDWIITNPPFNESADFVLKALQLAGTGVAMFVRLTWLESVGRYEKIFRDHPPTLLAIFTERVPLHKGRWEEDGTTMTAYIWLVWIKGAAPQTPFWIPPGCRERLTREGDVKRFGKMAAEWEAA